jgi:hypothetical protein
MVISIALVCVTAVTLDATDVRFMLQTPEWIASIFGLSREITGFAEETGALESLDSGDGASGFEALIALLTVFAMAATLLLVILLVLSMLAVVVLLGMSVLGGLSSIWLLVGSVRAQRAELRKRTVITSVDHMTREVRQFARLSRRTFGPRMSVVSVDEAVWRNTVAAFAARASVVLIDVSAPSKNLVWELQSLSPDVARVFVAERNRIESWIDPAVQPPNVATIELTALLDGAEVLVYEAGRRSYRRFARRLRSALESTSQPRRRSSWTS